MMDKFTQRAAELYQSGMSLSDVAAEMKTSKGYVSRKLRAGGVPPKRNTKNFWTEAEDSTLRKSYALGPEVIAALIPSRSMSAIKNRIGSLGLVPNDRKRKLWGAADYEYIEKNAALSDYALAKAMGVTGSSVKSARKRVGQVKRYVCRVCDCQISQQGNFCRDHLHVGRQMRSYTSKAGVKGREFSLSEEETYKLLTSSCAYCGGPGHGIDRIDSNKGYVQGNVAPCCRRCNAMKNDMTLVDFEAHIRRIAAHMGVK